LIKAIETIYNGYRFRSRLEARWAVFFDALGIEYEYEPEGYEYWADEVDEEGRPMRWLPDFRLTSEDNILVEVKGSDEQLKQDWPRLSMAVDYFNTPASNGLLILGDIPNPNDVKFGSLPIFSYLHWNEGVDCDFAAFVNNGSLMRGINKIFRYLYDPNKKLFTTYSTSGGGNGDWMPECVSTKPRIQSLDNIYSYKFDKLKAAYAKARQARFEYGETP
jgi:hypothetical protein